MLSEKLEGCGMPAFPPLPQAVLALAASWTSRQVGQRTLTGTVIDSGDGVTHVIPVAEGYVIGSCIKHIPIAGRDITDFILQLLRERESGIPPAQQLDTAKAIKVRILRQRRVVCSNFTICSPDCTIHTLQLT